MSIWSSWEGNIFAQLYTISNEVLTNIILIPAPQEQATRLFTGNSAIDAGAAGAALGAAAQFIGRQILNPCRGGTRGANSNTNTRFVNGETLQNGALGFLAGFAGSSLVSNALGNPCGK